MIHDTVAVCGFEATIDNKRKIIGIVKEAEQAKKEYDEAIKQGHGAYLLEEQDSEVFKCSVGNIKPGQTIEIQIKYMIELKHDAETDSVRFTLPATIAPKYGSHIFNHKRMRLFDKISDLDFPPLESMKGRSIEKASKALQYLLLSIPETIKKVQKITAKGGTHIYEALEWVFEHSRSDMPTSVLLFSDFETSHASRIVKLIKDHQEKKHDLRIFSIGMNNIVSNHFIESIVRVGKGYAQYVSDLEQMNRKAMTMLRNSLNPPISDYEITWTVEPNEESRNSGLKVQQVPLKIPELYIGVRSIIYCILEKGVKPCDQITLKSKFQVPLIVPLDQSPLQGSKIHTLATKKLIQEIEYGNYYPNHAKNEEYIRKQIVYLAKSYNLSSKYTSIEDHEKKKQEIEKKLVTEKYQIPKMQNAFGFEDEHEKKLAIELEKQKNENQKDTELKKGGEKKLIMEFVKEPENQDSVELEKREKAMMNEKFKDLERQKEVELKKEILRKENEIERLKKAERKKGDDNSLQFPSGDFYIKSAISLSDVSTSSASAQNMVVDIKHSLFMPWCIVKDGTKAIIAQQKNVDQDGHQLWRHENGLLINKQTNLCLEAESGTYLSVHQKRNSNQSNNQRWILTTEGRIALKKNPKFVIEVLFKGTAVKDGLYLTLTNSKSKKFKDDLRSKFVIVHKKPRLDCAIIGVIRLELIGVKNIDSSFTKGKSYIRIFNEVSKETVTQTKISDNDLDPIWNEVHYLPIKNIGDKFMFDVMDYCSSTEDKSLGNYHFEVNRDFVKEISEAKFFSLEPLPIPTPDFLSDLKENPFNFSTLCVIIALQAQNGSFPPSNTLANIFGYESPVKLFDLYKSHCCEDRVLNIDKTVWTT
ncbi:9062_t:CDS:10, partial [Racocetra fulgida]